MSTLRVLLLASMAGLLPSPASAILIDQGITTLDTATGLQWLDLTATAGQSYNSVAAGFGGFTTTQGFQFATESQVATLFTNAGFSTSSDTILREIDGPPTLLLLELMGCISNCTEQPLRSPSAQGLADFDTFNPVSAITPFYRLLIFEGVTSGNAFVGTSTTKGSFAGAVGSYLIRPIPEPSTLLLLGSGLAGLAGWRRKQARGRS